MTVLEPVPGSTGLAACLGLAGLAAAAVLVVLGLEPPAPLPGTAPAESFAAGRAMAHVEALAARPRPIGAAAHLEARRYLLEELAELGLAARVQEATAAFLAGPDLVVGGRVHNVLGRLSGDRQGAGVLLASHYDSRSRTPGAGDAAAGVAAILEAVRALQAAPPSGPRTDLMVLFTDGEEAGLLGARAFVQEDPWLEDVGLVLNFEARGDRGRSLMFQTSSGDLGLVRAFADADPHPWGNSLSDEVYRRMPNDTDFTVFLAAGLQGMNFAFAEGHAAYHTWLDTPGRLDRGSLQHHGEHALSLSRRFLAGIPRADREAIYFNPLGWWLLVHPQGWAVPLGWGVAGLAVAGLLAGAWRRALRPGRVAQALLLVAVAVVVPAGLALLLGNLLAGYLPQLFSGPHGLPHSWRPLVGGVMVLTAAVGALVFGQRFVHLRPAELLGGATVAWALLALGATLWLPGASYLFLWPAMGVAVALPWTAAGPARWPSPGRVLLLSATALPAVLLLAPVVYYLIVALPLSRLSVATVPVSLVLAIAAPLLMIAGVWSRGRPASLLGVLALALLAWGAWPREPSATRPVTDHLLSLLDAEAGEARWISFDREADAWTGRVLGAGIERGPVPPVLPLGRMPPVLQAPAPALELSPPEAVLLRDRVEAGARTLEVLVRSSRRAPVLLVRTESLSMVRAVLVDGRRVPLEEEGVDPRLLFFGLPPEGLRVGLEMGDRQPVLLELADLSYGLPPLEDGPGERPPGLIPDPGWWSDVTLVRSAAWF